MQPSRSSVTSASTRLSSAASRTLTLPTKLTKRTLTLPTKLTKRTLTLPTKTDETHTHCPDAEQRSTSRYLGQRRRPWRVWRRRWWRRGPRRGRRRWGRRRGSGRPRRRVRRSDGRRRRKRSDGQPHRNGDELVTNLCCSEIMSGPSDRPSEGVPRGTSLSLGVTRPSQATGGRPRPPTPCQRNSNVIRRISHWALNGDEPLIGPPTEFEFALRA